MFDRLRQEAHRIGRLPFYQNHCYFALPMAGWFVSSALLSAYNKHVFGDKGPIHFPCPLFLTSLHFASQWLFSDLVCAAFPEKNGWSRMQALSWKEWASISIPCGVVTAADVGLSNLSMVSITLTFYTMVKASTPVFVLFWAWLFRIERITWPLIGVIAVIAAGEFLTVVGEVDFVWTGFAQCLTASVLSGARWTLVQLKLQSLDPPLSTSLATMRILAPSMFVSLLLTALAIERPWEHLEWKNAGFVLALAAIGSVFAIAMVLCEFMLILQASAIVLMIGGVMKELLNIAIGMSFFGDTLNLTNALGFTVVFGGVILYKLTFHGPHAATERTPVPGTERYGPVARNDADGHAKSSNHGIESDEGAFEKDAVLVSPPPTDGSFDGDPEDHGELVAAVSDDSLSDALRPIT
jgi:solute carrier family 35 protein C2